MKTKYFVRGSKNLELRFDNLKEAFEMAKEIACYDTFVTLTKRTWKRTWNERWNERNVIVGYETVVVNADGTFTNL